MVLNLQMTPRVKIDQGQWTHISIGDIIQQCKELHAAGKPFPVEFSIYEWDVFNAIVAEFRDFLDFGRNSLDGQQNIVAFISPKKK